MTVRNKGQSTHQQLLSNEGQSLTHDENKHQANNSKEMQVKCNEQVRVRNEARAVKHKEPKAKAIHSKESNT